MTETSSHNQLLHLCLQAIGTRVSVLVKDGTRIHGHLYATHVDGDFALALRGAHTLASPRPQAELVISSQDFVALTILTDQGNFMTDTAISGGVGPVRERELQKWTPSEPLGDLSLESSGNTSWDQFAVNEKKFGVTTDFDEELYTTKLDKNRPEIKAREAEAARIAAEIERGVVNNVHMAEERGMQVEGDEEELYSSVIRDKYVPPGLRKEEKKKVEKIPPAPLPEKPTSRPTTPKDSSPKDQKDQSPKDHPKDQSRPATPPDHASPKSSPKDAGSGNLQDVALAFRDYSTKERMALNVRRKELEGKTDLRQAWDGFKSWSESVDISKLTGEKNQRPKTSASVHPLENAPIRKSSEPNLKEGSGASDAKVEEDKVDKPTEKSDKTTDKPTDKPKEESKFKFNVDAPEFSFNLEAEEFVPGGNQDQDRPPYYHKQRPQQPKGRPGMKEGFVGGYQKKGFEEVPYAYEFPVAPYGYPQPMIRPFGAPIPPIAMIPGQPIPPGYYPGPGYPVVRPGMPPVPYGMAPIPFRPKAPMSPSGSTTSVASVKSPEVQGEAVTAPPAETNGD